MLSLVILSVIMAIITLVAGFLPFLLPSHFDTTMFSQFGTGVILGSAFLLVIPESYEQIDNPKLTWVVGISVVSGFLLMLAIDAALIHKHDSESNIEEDSEVLVTPSKELVWTDIKTWGAGISFTTLGLTVHAAADGIALGSTAGSSSNKVEFLVFLSIILHKAPAALSLTSILLAHKKPQTDNQIKRDLLLFSLAGPVLAIALGGLLTLLNLTSGMKLIPGICLAISAGTFLFVATHVLEHARAVSDQWKLIGLMAVGTICPLLATMVPE